VGQEASAPDEKAGKGGKTAGIRAAAAGFSRFASHHFYGPAGKKKG